MNGFCEFFPQLIGGLIKTSGCTGQLWAVILTSVDTEPEVAQLNSLDWFGFSCDVGYN